MVEVCPDISLSGLLREIAQEIGVDSHGKPSEIRKRIVSKLKGSNRILIIDEAEHLTPKPLEILRRIHDWAKIPVVLVGMPKLYYNVKSLRKDFEQIANRMISYNLDNPTNDDLRDIISASIPKCGEPVIKALTDCSKGTIRTLIILMQILVNYSASTGKPLTADIVHKFMSTMH